MYVNKGEWKALIWDGKYMLLEKKRIIKYGKQLTWFSTRFCPI